MDVTFSVDSATGAASLAVPIFDASAGNTFSPALRLRYDSRWGNGPFGVGWRVPVPFISRKTEGGSPRYHDDGDPDTLVLSETGEILPLLDRWGDHARDATLVAGAPYAVYGYLPRSGGAYTSIQRFRSDATGETHWRTVSKDNITDVYGTTAQSRIADPADPSRVFAWLLDFSYDSSGRAITYEYVAENGAGVEPSAGEQQRQVTANRYLKRVLYGFATPYGTSGGSALPADWRFQLVFDYGEHCSHNAGLNAEAEWPARLDPFSTYRAGFEVRTYRLCHRVLQFHRKSGGSSQPELLGTTTIEYAQGPAASFITSVKRDSLPPLQLDYGEMVVDSATRSLQAQSTEFRIPGSNHTTPASGYPGTRYSVLGTTRPPKLISSDRQGTTYLADMSGDGLADLVSVRNGEVCYWPNLGRGRFGHKVTMTGAPTFDDPERFDPKRVRIADIDGSGTSDLIYLGSEAVAFWFNQSGNGWSSPHELPPVHSAGELSQVSVLDLLGSGTACIAWHETGTEYRVNNTFDSVLASRYSLYIDLMGGQVPRLLVRINDNIGTETRIRYGPTCVYRSDDPQVGPPACTSACPVQVVELVERLDNLRDTWTAESYTYRGGYIDVDDAGFLGFGMVERWDTRWPLSAREQRVRSLSDGEPPGHPTRRTVTWYHNGATIIQGAQARHASATDRAGDPTMAMTASMLETKSRAHPSERELRDAAIAIKGCIARQEIYTGDADENALPQEITVYDYKLRLVQPTGRNRHAVFEYECEAFVES